MLTRLAAQGMVDSLSGLTLAASVLMIARRPSPLRARLVLALGGLAVFFVARAAAEVLDWRGLERLTLFVACALPLAGLLLAEGVLRRHAPRFLKIAIVGAALATAAWIAVAGGQPQSRWILGGYVVAALAAVTLLLLARDRSTLSRQENAGVAALVAAALVVTLASIADFLPRAPVALSGLGAATVAFVVAGYPASAADARRAAAEFAVLAVLAAFVGVAMGPSLNLANADEEARLAAMVLSLLLAAGAIVGAARARFAPGGPPLGHALAAADTGTLERFLDSLADQPLLAGLRIADGAQLGDYDAAGLAAALPQGSVWTTDALAHSPLDERPREELTDLLARTESTHAVLLARAPVRIGLLTLPESAAGDSEAELALFGKLAAIASGDGA
jgi:hypothetical protein